MRALRLAPLLLAGLLAGCTGATPEPPTPYAHPSTETPEAHTSFEHVDLHPPDPRAGQGVIVRAAVAPPGFDTPPRCYYLVGPQGKNGGGMSGGHPMSERGTYRYECEVPPSPGNDFIAIVLVGHDGAAWVRSDLVLVRTPDGTGAGKPGIRIDALDVVDENKENIDVRVRVAPAALANPVAPLATGVAETHRFPRNHLAFLGMGLRLEAREAGVLAGAYPRVFPRETPPDAPPVPGDTNPAASDPDFVLLTLAYAYDDAGAYDVSALVESGHGACARERCMRT